MSRFEEHSLLQRAVHQFKYEFIEELAGPLGQLLFETFRPLATRESARAFVLCPLPLHPKRERWRGFNQAELLCSVIVQQAHRAGLDNVTMEPLLERVHFTTPQMELTREARKINVEGAFRLRAGSELRRLRDSTIVLVDDIATTLSTLNAAAEPLKKAGSGQVFGLVLARVFECVIMTP